MVWMGASPHLWRIDNNFPVPLDVKLYLIVESTFLIQEVKELWIGFASPQLKVSNFKITPNYARVVRVIKMFDNNTYNGIDCMSFHHRRI